MAASTPVLGLDPGNPLLGRFGTPDPTTENPFSTQGWNRYSYVGNSPLNFTDPSGYCFAGCFWQAPFKALGGLLRRIPILGNILTIAAAALCAPGAVVCAGIVSSLTSAAVTGLASGKLGLALKAGLISAATAIAMYEAGELTGNFSGTLTKAGGHGALAFLSDAHVFNIVAHAAVGCGSAIVSGGKCGPGALSGAAGSFATPLTNGLSVEEGLVVTTTAGGFASVAGGGKFGNGAVTAAFGYLFNAFAEVLGWGGSRLGAMGGGALCAEGGPLAVVCGLAGASVGRAAGGGIGAWLDGILWNESSSGANDDNPVPGTDKQFGQKYGQHYDPNLPGYRTPEEYRALANQVYNDEEATRISYDAGSRYPGEIHIEDKAGNLLRLDPQGNFRSLYPTK